MFEELKRRQFLSAELATSLTPEDIRPIVTNARAVKPKPTKEKR